MKTISASDEELIRDVLAEGLSVLPPAAFEKDVLLSEVLDAISNVNVDGIRLIFCGGTCLSKAHALIERMSEDIDFKVVVTKNLSRSARSRLLSSMKKELVLMFDGLGFVIPANGIKARNENAYIQIELEYQARFKSLDELRPFIQVELNANPPVLPTQTMPITSILGQLVPSREQDVSIECVGLQETLAEKVLSFLRRTAEHLTGRTRGEYDTRLVRHLYDVHAILVKNPDLALPFEHFESLVSGDATQFKNQYPEFVVNPIIELKKALAALESDSARFESYYNEFVSKLVYGKPVSYASAKAAFGSVASELIGRLPPTPLRVPDLGGDGSPGP